MKISLKIGCLKNTALKMNFGCEIYALFKNNINNNQRVTWKVEVGPRGDDPPYLTFLISSLLK
jgi:hypothetical protein